MCGGAGFQLEVALFGSHTPISNSHSNIVPFDYSFFTIVAGWLVGGCVCPLHATLSWELSYVVRWTRTAFMPKRVYSAPTTTARMTASCGINMCDHCIVYLAKKDGASALKDSSISLGRFCLDSTTASRIGSHLSHSICHIICACIFCAR